MSLKDLYEMYENYTFMCNILKVQSLPMRQEDEFIQHMEQLYEDNDVTSVDELHDKLKLHDVWA